MTTAVETSASVEQGRQRLSICPLTIREAVVYINNHHRHHIAREGALFAIGAAVAGKIVGVALVGRPVARMLQDGWTAEVNRLCTDGTRNTCSMLYGACWRAARAMGYRRLVTYTLTTEPGTSLRAAGWKLIGEAGSGSWSRKTRPRVDKHPTQLKLRWQRDAD